jgi:hypothetical protein
MTSTSLVGALDLSIYSPRDTGWAGLAWDSDVHERSLYRLHETFMQRPFIPTLFKCCWLFLG